MKNIYCIIVTYNGMEWIEKCLGSLLKSSYPCHVIVVDNGSGDFTVSCIKEKFPATELIESKQNLGFGQANNIGIEKALANNADYVFLLNQDAWVEPDTIEKLVRAQSQHKNYGIISPIHLNGDGSHVDAYFLKYLNESTKFKFDECEILNNYAGYELFEIAFVNAAAWLISKDCLLKTGGFDPIFFHYGEDLNYCHRVLYKGFKIGVFFQAKIYHDRGDRVAKSKPGLQQIIQKDWIYFLAQACDIRSSKYFRLLYRRFFRCLASGIFYFITFDVTKARYHFFMVKKIVSSFSAIARSRQFSLDKDHPPFLKTFGSHKIIPGSANLFALFNIYFLF